MQKLLQKMLKKHLDEESEPKNANESPIREGAKGRATAIKSLSDTTLYTPALKKGMSPTGKRMAMIANNDSGGNSEIVDRISEFVEQMHFESNSIADKQQHGWQEELPQRVDDDVGDNDPNEVVRQSAKWMVLQAENFKASVSKNKDGEFDQLINYIKDNDDDEFFHATCHIDMCRGITRIHRSPSRPSHPYGQQLHSLIFMSTLYKATCCLPADS